MSHWWLLQIYLKSSQRTVLSFSLPEALLFAATATVAAAIAHAMAAAPLKLITSCHNHVKAHDYQPLWLAFPFPLLLMNKKVLTSLGPTHRKASFSPESHSPFARGGMAGWITVAQRRCRSKEHIKREKWSFSTVVEVCSIFPILTRHLTYT